MKQQVNWQPGIRQTHTSRIRIRIRIRINSLAGKTCPAASLTIGRQVSRSMADALRNLII